MLNVNLPASTDRVDVVVIGGGAAGLAAATSLARSLRSVVVVDAGQPRNATAHSVHAFLSRDGIPPGDFLKLGREEVGRYGGTVRDGRVERVRRDGGDDFSAFLADGSVIHARRVLVATGIRDVLPPVDGIVDHWGRDVVHCPFCHGWEVRGRRIGVLVTGQTCLHQAAMFGHLTDDLVLLAHTSGFERRVLDDTGFDVVEGTVTRVVGDERLTGVQLDDGQTVELGALVVAPVFEVAGALLSGLGLETVDHPSGVGRHVPATPDGQTDVDGVWAAGNVTDPMAQVIGAAAQGNLAGARIHSELLTNDRIHVRS